jgi:hypothetical protein
MDDTSNVASCITRLIAAGTPGPGSTPEHHDPCQNCSRGRDTILSELRKIDGEANGAPRSASGSSVLGLRAISHVPRHAPDLGREKVWVRGWLISPRS